MRVPVQFPDNLFIARDQRVQIINPAPMSEGRSFAGRWIQMPVSRIAEAQFAEAQKIESATKRLLRAFEHLAPLACEALLDNRGCFVSTSKRWKETKVCVCLTGPEMVEDQHCRAFTVSVSPLGTNLSD